MVKLSIIGRALHSIDILGLEVDLKHLGSRHYRTAPGGTLTLVIVIFIIYCVCYFGEDLYYREKPISRFSKMLNNSTAIPLTHFPTPLSFVQVDTGAPIYAGDTERNVTIIPYWLLIDYLPLGLKGVNIFPMLMEKCSKDHVSQYGNILTDDSYFNYSYCANNKKYINGTTIQEGTPFIQGEFNKLNSSLIYYSLNICVNSTLNANKCAPQAEIDKFLRNINMIYSYLDSYVDLNSYENPYNYFLNRQFVRFK
jgi:hypothetical protein